MLKMGIFGSLVALTSHLFESILVAIPALFPCNMNQTSLDTSSRGHFHQLANPSMTLPCPPAEVASSYFGNLAEMGFLTPYKGYGEGRFMQLAFPITIPRALAEDLAEGSKLNQNFLREAYRSADALFERMTESAPEIAGRKIITPEIARQIFDRHIAGRVSLPTILDVMMTTKGPQVVENQTGFGYLSEFLAGFEAAERAGVEIPKEERFMGSVSPEDAVVRYKELIAGKDGVVHVVDVDALTDGSVGDRAGLARLLGNGDTRPLDLKAIDKDPFTGAIYFHDWRVENGELVDSGERVFPTAIFNRATPSELKQLEAYFVDRGQPEKAEYVSELYRDETIQWALHPGIYCLIDKGNLNTLAAYAREAGDLFSPYFPAMRSEGQAVQPGNWAIKIRDGNSGEAFGLTTVVPVSDLEIPERARLVDKDGSSYVRGDSVPPGTYRISYEEGCSVLPEDKVTSFTVVPDNEVFRVPTGYVAQEQFKFAPIDVEVPTSVNSAGRVPGTLEIRCVSYPTEDGKQSIMFGYRLAPRVNSEGRIVLTNLAPSMRAYDEMTAAAELQGAELEEARNRSLFGMGAVRIGKE